MADQLCVTCRYWTKVRVEGPGVPGIPGTPAMGSCKRHAPRPTVGTGHAHVIWPQTAAGEFCGEWRPQGEVTLPAGETTEV
ncbi:MAG: hypothetical protein ACK4TG_04400 [Thermaurantiacus sp.]